VCGVESRDTLGVTFGDENVGVCDARVGGVFMQPGVMLGETEESRFETLLPKVEKKTLHVVVDVWREDRRTRSLERETF